VKPTDPAYDAAARTYGMLQAQPGGSEQWKLRRMQESPHALLETQTMQHGRDAPASGRACTAVLVDGAQPASCTARSSGNVGAGGESADAPGARVELLDGSMTLQSQTMPRNGASIAQRAPRPELRMERLRRRMALARVKGVARERRAASSRDRILQRGASGTTTGPQVRRRRQGP